jgi:hypothetical protein
MKNMNSSIRVVVRLAQWDNERVELIFYKMKKQVLKINVIVSSTMVPDTIVAADRKVRESNCGHDDLSRRLQEKVEKSYADHWKLYFTHGV